MEGWTKDSLVVLEWIPNPPPPLLPLPLFWDRECRYLQPGRLMIYGTLSPRA